MLSFDPQVLLLYVVPGYIGNSIRRAFHPSEGPEAHQEVLSSFFLSFVAVSIVKLWWPTRDEKDLFFQAMTFGVSALLGCLMGGVAQLRCMRDFVDWAGANFDVNTWVYVFRKSRPAWVRLWLDECYYDGKLQAYSQMPSDTRELVLVDFRRYTLDNKLVYEGKKVYLLLQNPIVLEFFEAENGTDKSKPSRP